VEGIPARNDRNTIQNISAEGERGANFHRGMRGGDERRTIRGHPFRREKKLKRSLSRGWERKTKSEMTAIGPTRKNGDLESAEFGKGGKSEGKGVGCGSRQCLRGGRAGTSPRMNLWVILLHSNI